MPTSLDWRDPNYCGPDYEDEEPDYVREEINDDICTECDGEGTLHGHLCKPCQGTGRL
jgi:hypothetical protein